MTIKVTTESWKIDCTEEHKGLYDYSLSIYKSAKDFVTIICPIHGKFSQRAGIHKSGHGCPECAEARKGGTQRLSTEQFVSNATKAWGTLYDHSKVDYKCSSKKVEIICKEHGSFWMTPSNHVKSKLKQGCPKCSRIEFGLNTRSTQDSFLSDSLARHGELYDYSKAVYVGDKVKVIIGCKLHGDFTQVPSNHLQGQGCPKCKKSGYQTAKPGHLYVLSDGSTTKVGITNRSVVTRSKEVARSGGPTLDIKSTFWFEDGEIPLRIEGQVHKYLNEHYTKVDGIFDGSTECFLDVDLKALTDFIVPLASSDVNNHATA